MENIILNEAIFHSDNLSKIDGLFEKIKVEKVDKNIEKYLKEVESLYKKEFGFNVEIYFSKEPESSALVSYPILKPGIKGVVNKIKELVTAKIKSSDYHEDGKVIRDIMDRTNTIKLREYITIRVVLGQQFSGLPKYNKLDKHKLVYDHNDTKNFTGRHLNSVILHEIGHVIHAESNMERNVRGFRKMSLLTLGLGGMFYTVYSKLKYSYSNKKKGLRKITVTDISRSFSNGSRGYAFEVEADNTAVKYGYGKELHETLGKIMNNEKMNSRYDTTEGNIEIDLRRGEIIRTLEKEISDPRNPKEYVKEIKKHLNEIKNAQNIVESHFLNEKKIFRGDSVYLVEASIYDNIHNMAGISSKDCKYLNSAEGIADVVRGDYESILTTIKLEAENARDVKDIGSLKEIMANVKQARVKIQAIVDDTRLDRMSRGKALKFIHELDYVVGRDLTPALKQGLKSLYLDRSRDEF